MNTSRVTFIILGVAMLLAAVAGFVSFANAGSGGSLVLGIAGLVLAVTGFVLAGRVSKRKE